jgi:flagellin
MSFSILNNISSLSAQNQLSQTQSNLNSTLLQLASGSRLNSGANDAAGLAIADGLHANEQALQQSQNNASDGTGKLQVADGALSQVTNLLDRAVTLATEASTGTVTSTQQAALDNEFQKIKTEINNIGTNTTFNGTSVFSSSTTSVFLSDASSSYNITISVGGLSSSSIAAASGGSSSVDLSSDALTSATGAQSALSDINSAIANVASKRGEIGATINQLQSASNVISTQLQNVTGAEDNIRAANIPQEISALSQYNILTQTGISALAQSNAAQQAVLKLVG